MPDKGEQDSDGNGYSEQPKQNGAAHNGVSEKEIASRTGIARVTFPHGMESAVQLRGAPSESHYTLRASSTSLPLLTQARYRHMELTKKIKLGLDETRMLILGAQILLGFQLRGVFAEAFEALPSLSHHAALIGLALLTIAVGLLIAPGPYHRLVYGGSDDLRLIGIITLFATSALLPFGLALGLDIYIALERVFGMPPAALAGGAAALAALTAWYGLPYMARAFHSNKEKKCRMTVSRLRRLRSGSNRC